MNVFITREIPQIAKQLLEKNNITVKVFRPKRNISESELIKYSKNADAIISLLTEKFDQKTIDQLSKCKIIANYAVGFNMCIDSNFCGKLVFLNFKGFYK